ncbi:hypothetical protein OROMI_014743 [Orobanche minor]
MGDLGTSLKLVGNSQEGLQKYYEAITIDPHYARPYYNLGVVYSQMMQFDTALNCYEIAAIERPMYAEAYCNSHKQESISPNFEIAKNNMVRLEGDIDQGVAHYNKALFFHTLLILEGIFGTGH